MCIVYLSPAGNWSCHCLAEHLNCVGRSWGLLCCHLFNPGSLLWLLTFTWIPFPFPASMTEAVAAWAFLRQQVLIRAGHVWGWSSVPCVGHFVCAGPQGLGGAVLGTCWLWWETSETSVEGEQPDALPWLTAACVQASSPAGVGSPAGVISRFNPFSTIPHCVAHSHTSRKGENLTCFFSPMIVLDLRSLWSGWDSREKGQAVAMAVPTCSSPGPLLPLEWRISSFWEVTSQ